MYLNILGEHFIITSNNLCYVPVCHVFDLCCRSLCLLSLESSKMTWTNNRLLFKSLGSVCIFVVVVFLNNFYYFYSTNDALNVTKINYILNKLCFFNFLLIKVS